VFSWCYAGFDGVFRSSPLWTNDDGPAHQTPGSGSGISPGHPVGATGARILATLAREMGRRDASYGLQTMCIGGGQGLTAVFERL
jgi:acetyl-CoA C-acetyltransferase